MVMVKAFRHVYYINLYTNHRVYLSLACIVHSIRVNVSILPCIYVEVVILVRANVIYMNDTKRKFCETFDRTEMGEVEFSLNMHVTRTKKFIQLDRSVCIHKAVDLL